MEAVARLDASELTQERLFFEHIVASRPLLITRAHDWPARARWTRERGGYRGGRGGQQGRDAEAGHGTAPQDVARAFAGHAQTPLAGQ